MILFLSLFMSYTHYLLALKKGLTKVIRGVMTLTLILTPVNKIQYHVSSLPCALYFIIISVSSKIFTKRFLDTFFN